MSASLTTSGWLVDGGALPAGALYIRRPADEELLRNLKLRHPCYVIGPHQIGKSSLRSRTQVALSASGVRCATVDLQSLGVNAISQSEWFEALSYEIGDRLGCGEAVLTYLHERGHGTPVQRWMGCLREVILSAVPEDLVVFIDELQATEHLRFPPDDFLGAIRALYNGRTDAPDLARLTFCLIGVVNPTALMRDPVHSPFNVATAVPLDDFTVDQMTAFHDALALLPGPPQHWSDAVFEATQGHPYMTQALLAELLKELPTATQSPTKTVEAAVQRRFLHGAPANAPDPVFAYALDQFRGRHEVASLIEQRESKAQQLALYERLLGGEEIEAQRSDPAQILLIITGLVAERRCGDRRLLRVRNRIFAMKFGRAWVEQQGTDRQIGLAVTHWITAGRLPQHLYHSETLKAALTWARTRNNLAPDENEFLVASVKEEERQRHRAEEQSLRKVYGFISAAAIIGSMLAFLGTINSNRQLKETQRINVLTECIYGDDKACSRLVPVLEQRCNTGAALEDCNRLGVMHLTGDGVPRDIQRAQLHFLRGCDGGLGAGCNELGRIYEQGLHADSSPNYSRAYTYYERACQRGDLLGCTNQGFLLERGLGVQAEPTQAAKLYERGCEGEIAVACSNLGWLLFKGLGVASDSTRAREFLGIACQRNLALGCVNLGKLLEKADRRAAEQTYRRACELNDARGCTSVGLLLSERGDKEQAFRYYQMACDMRTRDPRGCNNAGVLIEGGKGIPHDLFRAAFFYRLACDNDYGLGCTNLAELFEQGRGVQKDLQVAQHLRAKADAPPSP